MSTVSTSNLLIIDTATRHLRLGVSYGEDRLVRSEARVERSHGKVIMTRISDLMGSAGLQKRDLSAIVAAIGPGSFTGLRIGLSVAKGIAAALDIPIIGVSQFEVAAYRLRAEAGPVLVIVPFKSDAVFAARVEGGALASDAIDVMPVAAITEVSKQGRVAVFGLEHSAPGDSRVVALETDIADLAYLGRRKLAAGEVADPAELEPLYVQRSQAEIRFDERQRGE